MSLQDDIFDIRHALRRRPSELEAFSRICHILNDMEQDNEQKSKILDDFAAGIRAINNIMRMNK